jgi:hypothetical protein
MTAGVEGVKYFASHPHLVIPAQAGTHLPSYALHAQGALDPRIRGDDEVGCMADIIATTHSRRPK